MDTNEKAIEMHKKWNGKLETISKTPVKTREDLSIAYNGNGVGFHGISISFFFIFCDDTRRK